MRPIRSLKVVILFISCFACVDDSRNERVMDQYLEDYDPPADLWRLVSISGDIICQESFDDIKASRDGLYPASRNGLWGYYNISCQWVIVPQYIEAHAFNDGVARVRDENGLYGFIDPEGRFITATRWTEAFDACHGYARIKIKERWSYFNTRTGITEEITFDEASDFHNGFANIRIRDRWYRIDTNLELRKGDFDLPPLQYKSNYWAKNDDLWMLFSNETKLKISRRFEEVESMFDGLAVARSRDTFYLVDSAGSILYSTIEPIINLGAGWVSKFAGDAQIIYNLNSQIQLSCDEAHRFSNGRAVIRQGENWNWIDTNGKAISASWFNITWPMKHEIGRSLSKQGITIVDLEGKTMSVLPYLDSRLLCPEVLAVKNPL